MKQHPNTFVAAATMLAGWLATTIADRLGYNLSEDTRAYIVGAAVAGVLFVGQRGIKGTLLALWRGGIVAWAGTQKK